jgi:hypothetical protein
MRAEAAEITVSSVAARARVHRSFIHRHPELRAAVIAAAEDPAASGPAGAAAVSRRSLLADNANLREQPPLNSRPAASNSGYRNCWAPRSASAPDSARRPISPR